MAKQALVVTALILLLSSNLVKAEEIQGHTVTDSVIASQNEVLAAGSGGFGPQSPRDISVRDGMNHRIFTLAPERQALNLCNIHLHENAEHRGGEFTTYAGNGDGHGNGTGYKYNGTLTAAERVPVGRTVGESEEGSLVPGDTVEIHFVYTSADAQPGVTLGACFTDATKNPQLRVEGVVAVLVNDPKAGQMTQIAEVKQIAGLYQVPNLPDQLGTPVRYAGSTTGPSYNAAASPFQVTWNVRPKVAKIDLNSLAAWLDDNPFKETHAHGVRNLVVNPALLSPMD